ncbi:MAG: VOC family protein [Acidobacteria bacterium]|nr:VOC family protein [Acidobacteriota bacterium]
MTRSPSLPWLVMLAALAAGSARGASPAPRDPLTPFWAAIVTDDAERTAGWYQSALGFKRFHAMEFPEAKVKVLLLERDCFNLEVIGGPSFVRAEDLDPRAADPDLRQGIVKLSFRTADIRTLSEILRQKGAVFLVNPSRDPTFGDTFNLFKDPDGNLLQLFQPPDRRARRLGDRLEAGVFALIVADLDAAAAWYARHLGFRVERRVEAAEAGVRVAFLDRDGFTLELIAKRGTVSVKEKQKAAKPETMVRGYLKLGFLVRDLDAWARRFSGAGVAFKIPITADKPTGTRFFLVEDNEGNVLQLFEKVKP